MAEQKFNAIEGFSVGANATPIADSNANIQANNKKNSVQDAKFAIEDSFYSQFGTTTR